MAVLSEHKRASASEGRHLCENHYFFRTGSHCYRVYETLSGMGNLHRRLNLVMPDWPLFLLSLEPGLLVG